jgi:hypothetical protein
MPALESPAAIIIVRYASLFAMSSCRKLFLRRRQVLKKELPMSFAWVTEEFCTRLRNLSREKNKPLLDKHGNAVTLCNHERSHFAVAGVAHLQGFCDLSKDVVVHVLCPLCTAVYDISIPASNRTLRKAVNRNLIEMCPDGGFAYVRPRHHEDLIRLGLTPAERNFVRDYQVVSGLMKYSPSAVTVGEQTALVYETVAIAIDLLRPNSWIRYSGAEVRHWIFSDQVALGVPYFIYDSQENGITEFNIPKDSGRIGLGKIMAERSRCYGQVFEPFGQD